MATKKKAKAKKKSKVKAKKPAVKKTKKVKKKVVKKKAKKAVARKPAMKKPAARKPAMATPKPMAAPVALPGEERIGIVTHYYSHLSVAIVQVESGALRTGDTVHIKGHTTDVRQTVQSMEVDHMHMDEVRPGQSFGLRVVEHARENDVVYKV